MRYHKVYFQKFVPGLRNEFHIILQTSNYMYCMYCSFAAVMLGVRAM